MRATKHAVPQAGRGRGLGMGIASALVTIGVLVWLAVVLLPGSGGGSRQPAAAFVGATPTSAPPTAGTPAGATPSAARPSVTSPLPAAAADTPSPSAAQSVRSASTAAPLPGRIKPGTNYRGVATSYDAADGNGACLYGPSGDLMIAAMNHADYESSKACGAYVLVRAANGASITVRIVNECPLPCAPGQLDLSREAFAKIADLSVGRLPVTWTLLSPGAPGAMSIRYKSGSTRWWCGIQVIGHRNPMAALEVRSGGGWRHLSRTEYNYFLSPDGSGCGGPIRVTDIYGERLTVDGIALRPDVAQPAKVQFARH